MGSRCNECVERKRLNSEMWAEAFKAFKYSITLVGIASLILFSIAVGTEVDGGSGYVLGGFVVLVYVIFIIIIFSKGGK